MQSLFSLRTTTFHRFTSGQRGSAVLILAGLTVAIAIATDGSVSRTFNGIAGLLWIASAGIILNALRDDAKFWSRLLQVLAICLVLVIFIRPSDLALALTGFSVAGAIIARTMGERGFTWATLLPALWLPVHLGTAVVKAGYRTLTDQEAALRSDPPPTAAIVPLAMIVGAMFGAWLVRKYLAKSR